LGEFTALDARPGALLWSSPTRTGVIAAPISYAIDGKQYVAIMVGTGGSWAMIGGDANTKGNNLPNISRLLVYALAGTAQLPPTLPRPERKLTAPPVTASGEVVGKGAVAYHTYCGNCHGVGAINLGILPDLRYSAALQTEAAWRNIVLGGALEGQGMVSFKPVLDDATAEAIRAFVITQAHATAQ
jgi:alcohol dehydrogenase (cytochrome c)/quinohemoprotein ethanol dehydrogenase